MMEVLRGIHGFIVLFTVPTEGWLRFSFGERYMNVFTVFIPTLLFWVLYLFLKPLTQEFIGSWLVIFFTLYPLVAGGHYLHNRFAKEPKIRHSYASGVSWFSLLLPWSEQIIKTLVEPLLVFIIGSLMYWLSFSLYHESYGLGIFLMGSSMLMFLRTLIEYQMARSHYLNVQDEMIESEAIMNFMNQKPSQNRKEQVNHGFVIPGKPMGTEESRRPLNEIYEKMKPHLSKSKDRGLEMQKETPERGREFIPEPEMDRDKY